MRRKQPTQVRQAQITEAALHLIGQNGIAALTMATLAAEVGVTTGALFRHFPSREAILEAVAARVADMTAGSLPGDTLPPLERLTSLAMGRAAIVASRPELVAMLFSEQVMLALPPTAVERLQDIAVATGTFVATTLQEAQAAGLVRADLPLPHLVALTMGTIRHLAFLSGSRLGGKVAGMAPPADIWQAYLRLISTGGSHDQHA
jgi:AcrR family transcriptional regulator